MLGTDTFSHSAARRMTCPFTGKGLVLLPALYPDVAAIHVHRADVFGNCQIDGITVSDIDLAQATKRVIITTERLVSTEVFRTDPARCSIPYYVVDAVVEVPYGSYPGNMPYEYFSDEDHLQEWLEAEKDPGALREFLDRNIYKCKDFNQYLEINGGLDKVKTLRSEEHLLTRD